VSNVLQDRQYKFGVRILLMVEKVLMTEDLAMKPAMINQQPALFFLQAFTSLLINQINA